MRLLTGGGDNSQKIIEVMCKDYSNLSMGYKKKEM